MANEIAKGLLLYCRAVHRTVQEVKLRKTQEVDNGKAEEGSSARGSKKPH